MENSLASTYPFPPSYFTYFTDENVKKVKEFEKQSGLKAGSNNSNNPGSSNNPGNPTQNEPPFPLSVLIPPKKPDTKVYRSFGNQWQFNNAIMSLKDVGIPQLYDVDEQKEDEGGVKQDGIKKEEEEEEKEGRGKAEKKANTHTRSQELKKLVHSLLIKFVELCGVMSLSPEQFPATVEEMRVILINAHHLMNEYRPHQSRESLLMLLQQQVDRTNEEVEGLKKKNEDIRMKIAGLTKRFKTIGSGIEANKSTDPDGDVELRDVSDGSDNSDKTQDPPATSTLTLTAKSLDQLSWGLLEYHERHSSVH